MTAEFVLIGGGARSGKSSFAIDLALRLSEQRLFIATAELSDAEMEERARRHRQERGDRFLTVEAPLRLNDALAKAPASSVVVIDCLTLWISNLIGQGCDDDEIDGQLLDLLRVIHEASFHCVVVTNEVGMGLVPNSPLGRRFRDCLGRANQRLAVDADRIFVAMLGCILQIKPTLKLVAPDYSAPG
jgi:adenosylcobinamide kinase/adenosylcobinamide-phosphate guanylyltransferase